MAREAEINSQNQNPFEQTARNFTMVNLSDQREAEDMKFWENDRQQREAAIAQERAAKRLTMTEEEIAQVDAADLAEAEAFETSETEQEREGAVLIL